MKIFHVLSQRPDPTGSGIYVQVMIREAAPCGYDNYLVAGVDADGCRKIDGIAQGTAMFVKFHTADILHHIPGMSDAMP
jgi:hypothetical protein